MPLSRFDNLDDAAKTRIVDAAQSEFAARGYEQASLSQIAAAAGISKGTLYYYFADRDDLYATVVLRVATAVGVSELLATFAPKRAQEYWPAIERLFRAGYELARKHPEELRALRSFNVSVRNSDRPVFAPIKALMSARLRLLVETGQRLGCVRSDFDVSLLVELLQALDDVLDREFFARATASNSSSFEQQAARCLDLFRRVLEPPTKSSKSTRKVHTAKNKR